MGGVMVAEVNWGVVEAREASGRGVMEKGS